MVEGASKLENIDGTYLSLQRVQRCQARRLDLWDSGVGGITHGIGEIRQGSVAPQGLMFDSLTEGPIAREMGGDPALSIVPNLLVTGILTLIVSCAVLIWSAAFVQRKRGGLGLMALSVGYYAVGGGGIGSPVAGILAGVAGTGIHARLAWWRNRIPTVIRIGLARLWPWTYGITLLNGLFLFIGAPILVTFVRLNNSMLFLNSFYFAVVSLLVTLLTTVARDIERRVQSGSAPAAAAFG